MSYSYVDTLNDAINRILQKSLRTFELLLLSAALISTLATAKGSLFPYSCEIVFSNLVAFRDSIQCILSSHLYICILINFMVALIAASSAFHRAEIVENQHGGRISESPPAAAEPAFLPRTAPTKTIPPPPESGTDVFTASATCSTFGRTCNDDDNLTGNQSTQNVSKDLSTLSPRQARVTKNRGSSSRAEEKENDEDGTMENTWRLITGGGGTKKKELRKSETWDVQPTVQRLISEELEPPTPKRKELRKSETFNDSVLKTCRGGLRRDPLTSLEEFNKQVEDFIKKFNDSMKLQRQESDQRLLDTMKRGI